jgi:hypothetical protein
MTSAFGMSFQSDFARFARSLDAASAQHLPFAVSRALTDTAKSTAGRLTEAIPTIFAKTTPFTARAVGFSPATRGQPQASVFVKPLQAEYLWHEEVGGVRTAAENTTKVAETLLLPGKSLPLNAYRNIPLGSIAKLRKLAAQDVQDRHRRGAAGAFGGAIKGKKAMMRAQGVARDSGVVFLTADQVPAPFDKIGGYFLRAPGHSLKRLTVFEDETHYRPKFRFREHFEDFAKRDFLHNLSLRFVEALSQGGAFRR